MGVDPCPMHCVFEGREKRKVSSHDSWSLVIKAPVGSFPRPPPLPLQSALENMLLNLALLGYVAAQATTSPPTQPAGDMTTVSAPTPTTVQGGAQTPDQSPAVASSPAAGGAGGAGGAGVSSIPTQASTAIPSSTLAPDTPVPGQDTLPPTQCEFHELQYMSGEENFDANAARVVCRQRDVLPRQAFAGRPAVRRVPGQ